MGIIPANVDLSCRGGKRVGGEKKVSLSLMAIMIGLNTSPVSSLQCKFNGSLGGQRNSPAFVMTSALWVPEQAKGAKGVLHILVSTILFASARKVHFVSPFLSFSFSWHWELRFCLLIPYRHLLKIPLHSTGPSLQWTLTRGSRVIYKCFSLVTTSGRARGCWNARL